MTFLQILKIKFVLCSIIMAFASFCLMISRKICRLIENSTICLIGHSFSCNLQFFGFKNQFVLRLFRELVANVNRKAVSSSSCVGDLETKHPTCCTEPYRQPDLVQYLEKSQVTGKRSRKCGVSAVKSDSSGTLKESQLEYQTHSTDVSASELRSQKKYIQNQKSSTFSPSNDSHGVCAKSGSVDASITSKTVDEVKDCLHSVYSSEHFNNEVCNKDESVFISSHNSAAMRGTMLSEEEPVRSYSIFLFLSTI